MFSYQSLNLAVVVLFIFTRKVVYSIQTCGRDICRDDEQCCDRRNHTTDVTCCKQFVDNTYYSIAMVTRKLSGVLIMLLLFAFGYFVQRMLCSRTRQLSVPYSGPPSAAASQEMLMESCTLDGLRDPSLSTTLPSYDDCKRLPTYEETVRESNSRQ